MAQSLVRAHAQSSRTASQTSPEAGVFASEEAASPAVAPSALSFETARSYVDARPFKRLGAWADTVSVARDGTMLRAASWMALHRREARTYEQLWARCQVANPQWFSSFRILRLDEPSFFLPAGDCVFQVITNPTQIPDHPPRGVLLRHWEAMTAAPHATFYFLRPVFTFDPEFRLYTADDLRDEAAGDRDEAIFAARLYGGAIRTAAWMRNRARDAARLALRGATLAVRGTAILTGAPARRRARSRELAEVYFRLHGRHGIDELIARTNGSDFDAEMVEFRRALRDLRARLPLDPILCFELPERPGELWFESHWFQGQDGKLYVAY
jgi:hypothetical protein